MAYKWILFDIDNTLFDFDRAEKIALEKAIKAFDIPFEDQQLEIYHHVNKRCWKQFEDGLLEQEKLKTLRFELFFKAIGYTRDAKKFNDTYLQLLVEHPFLIEGAKKLLEDLFQKIPMVVITNGLKVVQRPRLKAAGLTHLFEAIVVSEEIACSKPDAAFFDYTFQAINHPPKEEVLVIGDSLNSDIKGGNNYGIDTCWFNRYHKEHPSSIKPTYIISDLSDLQNILF